MQNKSPNCGIWSMHPVGLRRDHLWSGEQHNILFLYSWACAVSIGCDWGNACGGRSRGVREIPTMTLWARNVTEAGRGL